MALHWQPPNGDPVAEFTPEPVRSTPRSEAPARTAATALDTIPGAEVVTDAILLALGGVAVGAILFALYWVVR